MSIGTALVVIAILYLIDKHHLWKKAAIVGMAIVVLTGVVVGMFLLHRAYVEWQHRRSEAHLFKLRRQGEKTGELPCPPNGYDYEDSTIKCNATPITLPRYFFDNSDVHTKRACFDPESGKLTPDPFEKLGGVMTSCASGQSLVHKAEGAK